MVQGQINNNEDVRLRTLRAITNEKCREGKARRSISSAKQSKGQKVYSIIQSTILGNSIDKDMHHERT